MGTMKVTIRTGEDMRRSERRDVARGYISRKPWWGLGLLTLWYAPEDQ